MALRLALLLVPQVAQLQEAATQQVLQVPQCTVEAALEPFRATKSMLRQQVEGATYTMRCSACNTYRSPAIDSHFPPRVLAPCDLLGLNPGLQDHQISQTLHFLGTGLCVNNLQPVFTDRQVTDAINDTNDSREGKGRRLSQRRPTGFSHNFEKMVPRKHWHLFF